MENEYAVTVLDKKINDIETQLEPILANPLRPDATPSDAQAVVEKFDQQFNYVNNLFSAEMATSSTPEASSTKTHGLRRVGRNISRLQKSLHAWARGEPITPSFKPKVSTSSSLIESCLTDKDDQVGKEHSQLAGFDVHYNPAFEGTLEDFKDNYEGFQDEVLQVDGVKEEEETIITGEQVKVEGTEGGKEEKKKEISKVEDQKEKRRVEVSENGTQNYYFKVGFCVILIGMGITSLIVGFSVFPDHRSSAVFLVPT